MANGNTVSSPIGGQSNQGLSGLAGGSGNANGGVCSGNYIAQCCQLDVLGAAAVTCNTPSSGITSSQALTSDCAATGTTAMCCLIPVAGQALICHNV
ncbi:hypothetical protein CLAFUW4_13723 [Fulvia fulva]|uniref:Hydrophobin n=1 Tax=Passalora fulva TaxID=5499 RepID=A0A9Q8PL52_PASFU|nr:uncharacterized protein CLAFUR5_13571 [Fulvia fulva]KAK4610077.1 hypothetical protein CLAFUR4_13726 [Fulvia fulva]KAK4611035.1 hypothetical protein CLAFUR0_13730 [Fulvia fulva]UJO24440.1 hypothetical protein CLAFUR5_13571 [Fulvia fulva]WPV21788.1 hypothetical protein CLAFUW4_13723 [Fulvia fulva]WPV36846.1 hypothetical protein CLAFUW7_13731 [Fulvia fulva]